LIDLCAINVEISVAVNADSMKRKLRQRQILDLLLAEPELGIADVCARTGASEATVRREFVQLVKEGRAERTWGGIKRTSEADTALAPPAFTKRLGTDIPGKRVIAQEAATLLEEGDVVMIDGGTTTFQLCSFIALRRIRIITNSLVIASEVDRLKGNRRGAEIFLTGGILQPESGVVAGRPAEAFLKRYHARWAFLSAAGLDETAATNYNEAVLSSEQLMIQQSDRVALLVDRSKLGRQAMSVLCPIGKIDVLITNGGREEYALLEKLRASGVDVRVVQAQSAEPAGG
jgi:DeoR/GlpR family transcriptional regulator of sugar metabolism